MAGNAVYPLWKQSLMQEAALNKSLDQSDTSNSPYLSLVTIASGYVYSPTHQFYSSITNVVAGPQQLTTPTVTGTVFGADPSSFVNVTGTVIGAIVIHRRNTGLNTTWRLVLYEDTNIAGFPLSANGGNVNIKWNVLGIFALGAPS